MSSAAATLVQACSPVVILPPGRGPGSSARLRAAWRLPAQVLALVLALVLAGCSGTTARLQQRDLRVAAPPQAVVQGALVGIEVQSEAGAFSSRGERDTYAASLRNLLQAANLFGTDGTKPYTLKVTIKEFDIPRVSFGGFESTLETRYELRDAQGQLIYTERIASTGADDTRSFFGPTRQNRSRTVAVVNNIGSFAQRLGVRLRQLAQAQQPERTAEAGALPAAQPAAPATVAAAGAAPMPAPVPAPMPAPLAAPAGLPLAVPVSVPTAVPMAVPTAVPTAVAGAVPPPGPVVAAPLVNRPGGAMPDLAPVTLSPLAQVDGVEFGRYHALIIGIDAYRHITPLQTAVSDATRLEQILRESYGFETRLLRDASRDQIVSALAEYRRTLQPSDNLLIYYAGHGWVDEQADEGYWLPVDAGAEDPARWFSNATLTTTLRTIAARHVLVIADSCFSGKLTRGINLQPRTQDYLRRLIARKARTALTSGGLEPVLDSGGKGNHSVFASALFDALTLNTGIIDTSQMFNLIRREVALAADQFPEYGDIRRAGHEGGDFVFVRRKP